MQSVISRPKASDLPVYVKTCLTKSAVLKLLKKSTPDVVALSSAEWKKVSKEAALQAKAHPLYPIVLSNLKAARRSPESAVRRLEDILAWADTLESFVGRQKALETFSTLVALGEEKQMLRKKPIRTARVAPASNKRHGTSAK